MENKNEPKILICPLCNQKLVFCRGIVCIDCTYGDLPCNFDCNCSEEDMIVELQCQLIQSKIELSHLIARYIKVN